VAIRSSGVLRICDDAGGTKQRHRGLRHGLTAGHAAASLLVQAALLLTRQDPPQPARAAMAIHRGRDWWRPRQGWPWYRLRRLALACCIQKRG